MESLVTLEPDSGPEFHSAEPDSGGESTFGDDSLDSASSTASIRSAITRYQYENGRRYHAYKAGQYLFPNDETELERMDIEHHNQWLQLGALHLCPLVNPGEILDLGTGSGIWAVDMADQYPSAVVIGTDLSPEQPTWVPPNCKFEVDDYEDDWTYGKDRFDLVHARFILCTVSDYVKLYKKAFDAIKPGGYLEISDIECSSYSDDGTLPLDGATVKWWRMFSEASVRRGRPTPLAKDYKGLMEQAGFVDVQERIIKRPTNDWPKDPRMKDIGRFTQLNFLQGVEGFSMAPFTRVLGWSPEEVQVFLAQVRKEALNRSMHGYQVGVVAWGRKPSSSEA